MGNFGAPFPHFETQAFPMKKVEQVDWVRQPQLASDGWSMPKVLDKNGRDFRKKSQGKFWTHTPKLRKDMKKQGVNPKKQLNLSVFPRNSHDFLQRPRRSGLRPWHGEICSGWLATTQSQQHGGV